MKNFFKYLGAFFLVICLFTNTDESEFLYKIDNSKDPLSEFFSERWMKNANAIIEPGGKYFSPVFLLDYYNVGLFSIAKLEHGWMGNLRSDGKYLGENFNKSTKTTYLLIFGRAFKLSENKNFE